MHGWRGMQTPWAFGNATDVLRLPRPEVEGGYLTYGGDVYGTENHYPSSVIHYDDDVRIFLPKLTDFKKSSSILSFCLSVF
jgi:hypothetical protein